MTMPRAPHSVSAWQTESVFTRLPPKDPHEHDDGEDEEDDDEEEDDEPAVIREPDE
jgi:hypothetical protein